jgi:hypothetical protein
MRRKVDILGKELENAEAEREELREKLERTALSENLLRGKITCV